MPTKAANASTESSGCLDRQRATKSPDGGRAFVDFVGQS